MKTDFKKVIKSVVAVIASTMLLSACTTTIKIPKHPGPGEPPTPPKVEVQQN